MNKFMLMGPEDAEQPGGAGGAEAPAGAPDAAPAAPAAPVSAPAAPAGQQEFDYRAAWEAAQQELGSYRQTFDSLQKEEQRRTQLFRQMFDPEGYQRDQQPRPVTPEDVQRMLQQQFQAYEYNTMRASLQRELPAVQSKHPEFFNDPNLKGLLRAAWNAAPPGTTLMDVADNMAKTFDSQFTPRLDKAKAEWLKTKDETKETLRGSGPTPGASPAKSAPSQTTKRGIERFDDISTEPLQ